MTADWGHLVSVEFMPTRYRVRCSECGVIAVELSLDEAARERRTHQCPLSPNDGLARRHQEHYRSCNCLADSAECCVASCSCYPSTNDESET